MLLERLLYTQNNVAVIIEYAEMVAPVGDANFFSEADRMASFKVTGRAAVPAPQPRKPKPVLKHLRLS